jgi:hypothetical protein
VEDALGAWDASKGFAEFGAAKHASSAAQAHLAGKEIADEAAVAAKITSVWLAVNGKNRLDALAGIRNFFDPKNTNVMKNSESQAAIIEMIVRELEKAGPKIAGLDMSRLENGVHEMRRTIRWFPMYVGALDGLIEISADTGNSDVAEYNQLMTETIAGSPFVRTKFSGREAAKLTISRPYWLAMASYVKIIGDVKDAAQNIKFLSDAYAGVDSTDMDQIGEGPARLAVATLVPTVDSLAKTYKSEATKIQFEVERLKLFKKIKKEISK